MLGERRGIASRFYSCLLKADFVLKIFGPVLAVGKFHTEQEAIDLANDTTYGLAAALHSSNRFHFHLLNPILNCILADQAQCHRVSTALEAGTVSYLLAINYDRTYVISLGLG